MAKPKPFRWYKIVGHPIDGHSADFIYFVESAMPSNVIKYYGKRRKCDTESGTMVVQFPIHEKDVQLMQASWTPEQIGEPVTGNVETFVKVLPATRYICECGKEHVSEFPYPSMWCSCGKKALPLDKVLIHKAVQEQQSRPPMPYQ